MLCLSTFLHLFMEVLKSTHGDSVATEVEDSFVSGVHARVQAYIDSLEALRSEHEALQQRAAALQAEVDENGDEYYTEESQERFNSYSDEAESILIRLGFISENRAQS